MMNHLIVLALLSCCVALSAGYTTSGNKIFGSDGKQVLLRGIARPSLEWSTTGEMLSLEDYRLMQGWGANVVRLSLNQCFWLSGLVGYDSKYQGTVDQQVTWIKSLGMGVILDLHWSNKGNSGTKCEQQQMADSYSTTFWFQVATKYKNDPMVIFELYNEPHDVSWSSWRNGGPTADGFNTPGFQSLYNTVRGTGADNLVIVSGLNWAFDLSGVAANPITGTNIAYGTHPYDFAEKQFSSWATSFGNLATKYPVIATEFGSQDCSTPYTNSFLAYADANCISFTGWGWYPGGCNFPSLITDWTGKPSTPGLLIKTSLSNGPKTCGGAATVAATVVTAAATVTTIGKVSTTTAAAATTATSASAAATTTAKTATTATAASSTTTGASYGTSSTALQAYSDTVEFPFIDWSWATVKNAADGSRAQSGSKSYSFQPSNWGALYLRYPQGIDAIFHTSIQFYVYVPSIDIKWNFNMIRYDGMNSNKVGPSLSVSSYCPSYAANAWRMCTVPLSAFPAGKYDGFWFMDDSGASQPTVYVDTVSVVGK